MKKDTHPDYQEVLFVDSSTGHKFLCGTTLKPKETEAFEGKEYPVYRIPVSSASHPFFTGSQQFVDSEGCVDKFMKRYGNAKAAAPKEGKDSKEDSKKESKEDAKAKKKSTKKA